MTTIESAWLMRQMLRSRRTPRRPQRSSSEQAAVEIGRRLSW
jgi:hypothetical protein